MRIGNPAQLNAEREAIRDAFDAVWLASPIIGPKEERAIRCAIALSRPPSGSNWEIFKGGRACGHNQVIYA